MKTILRILVVIAAILAILAPASYCLLFVAFADWSALVDFVLVISCIILALAAFKHISFILWMTAFVIVAVFAGSGFLHHFQDSDESGPLPFEWLNGYFLKALPLLLLTASSQFLGRKKPESDPRE